MLIFKLLKKHAKRSKVHQANAKEALDGDSSAPDDCGSATGALQTNSNNNSERPTLSTLTSVLTTNKNSTPARDNDCAGQVGGTFGLPHQQQQQQPNQQFSKHYNVTSLPDRIDSDGIYRIPTNTSFRNQSSEGTRFIIGPRGGHYYGASAASGNLIRNNSLQV